MDRKNKIIQLINRLRKHHKWNSFYLKSIKEVIDVLNLPAYELIECKLNDLSENEDFCIPLLIAKNNIIYPALESCFKHENQNQIVGIINFDELQNPIHLSIYYLNQNKLSHIEYFKPK